MASRRNFTRNQREEIIERSKNERGEICCERCKLVLAGKPYEIDHIIAEGLRPEADKQKKITVAEGWLLGKECCHRGEDGKTSKDQTAIAKAKRQYDKDAGAVAPSKPIQSPGFRTSKHAAKREARAKDALPPLARRNPFNHEVVR